MPCICCNKDPNIKVSQCDVCRREGEMDRKKKMDVMQLMCMMMMMLVFASVAKAAEESCGAYCMKDCMSWGEATQPMCENECRNACMSIGASF